MGLLDPFLIFDTITGIKKQRKMRLLMITRSERKLENPLYTSLEPLKPIDHETLRERINNVIKYVNDYESIDFKRDTELLQVFKDCHDYVDSVYYTVTSKSFNCSLIFGMLVESLLYGWGFPVASMFSMVSDAHIANNNSLFLRDHLNDEQEKNLRFAIVRLTNIFINNKLFTIADRNNPSVIDIAYAFREFVNKPPEFTKRQALHYSINSLFFRGANTYSKVDFGNLILDYADYKCPDDYPKKLSR